MRARLSRLLFTLLVLTVALGTLVVATGATVGLWPAVLTYAGGGIAWAAWETQTSDKRGDDVW